MTLPSKPAQVMLSIDAGKNNVGWSLWDWTPGHRNKMEKPLACGSLDVPNYLVQKTRADEWEPRIRWLVERVTKETDYWIGWESHSGLCYNTALQLIVIECAEFRAGDAVGHAAAARGDLGALYVCAGAFLSLAWSCGAEGMLVTVGKWKRQLSKTNTIRRIVRAIGHDAQYQGRIESHGADAVGVGLHVKGFDIDDAKHFGEKAAAKKKRRVKKKASKKR